jgi:hypothetical protein
MASVGSPDLIRWNRRVKMAVQMAKLSAIKTLAGFDFAFQPWRPSARGPPAPD